MHLEAKVALVTGGASGIGRASSLALAREGARVAVADIQEKGAEAVAREIEERGGKAFARKVDLTRRAEVDQTIEAVIREMDRIDILVNGAGWDRFEPFVASEEDTWDKILAINFMAVLYTTKGVLPHMIERGAGKIINISSDAGRVGSTWEAVYSGAKGAIIAFSKTIAREVARHKINVNVVCPGLTDTPLLQAVRSQSPETERLIDAIVKATPFRRVAKPEEVAEAVLFLASPSADFITGQTVSVSGGLTMV